MAKETVKEIVPIDEIEEKIRALFKEHKEEIEEVWTKKGEEEDLTINMGVKLGIKEGNNYCVVGMSFVKEKVKDTISFPWNEKQENLFKGKEKEDPKANEKGNGF